MSAWPKIEHSNSQKPKWHKTRQRKIQSSNHDPPKLPRMVQFQINHLIRSLQNILIQHTMFSLYLMLRRLVSSWKIESKTSNYGRGHWNGHWEFSCLLWLSSLFVTEAPLCSQTAVFTQWFASGSQSYLLAFSLKVLYMFLLTVSLNKCDTSWL